ncbi:MAG: oligosaccharide flippase family protein [Segetibacter sp.]|nr:oligosaccharide flippase family protein [Segetibacter sp.]
MSILLSRYLQAGNAGWVFYLCNNFSFILILAGLTIENAITYYSSQKTINDDALAWFSLAWCLIVSLVIFTSFSLYLHTFTGSPFITNGQYLFYAVCYIAGVQLTNIFTVLFYANKDFFLPNLLMVLLNIVVIILIPKQVGTQNTNVSLIISLYFAYFVISGLALTVAFIYTRKSWKTFSFPSFANIKLIIKYALMALAANVIFFLVYRVDYWFVERYCTQEELGNYIQISRLGQMLLVIPSIISSVVFPHTAAGTQRTEIRENILRIGRVTSLLYIILFVLILVSGNWMFPLVFGNTYQLMYLPFLILLPGIWALSNLYILSAYYGGVNKVKVNVQGAFIALIVILTGDFLLIPKGGIIAAALVSTLGYLVNFLYSFLMLKNEQTVSIFQYFNINKDDIRWLRSFIQH